MENEDKRFVVCGSCLAVHYWTRDEYYANINCPCGCAMWAIDRDRNEAIKMARWGKKVSGL